MNTHPHRWSYCGQCERWTVICGQCGNNACNGGTGEVMGPEPGTTMPCPACESAYQMDMNETPPLVSLGPGAADMQNIAAQAPAHQDPAILLGDLLGRSIGSINLLVRTRRCLADAGIETLRDLYWHEGELRAIQTFGLGSFADLSDALAVHGLPAVNYRIAPAVQRKAF